MMENENPMEQVSETAQETQILQEPEMIHEPFAAQNSETLQQTPVKPKKNRALIIIAAVVLGVVLLGVLGWFVLFGTEGSDTLDDMKDKVSGALTGNETAATQPQATEPVASQPEATEPLNLKSYTVTKEEAANVIDNVVASVGENQLTNGTLQVFYQTSMINFYSQYGMYLSYMGVDFSQPLDQQVFDQTTNQTWQEYILEMALHSWHLYTAIGEKAKAEGYTLDEEGLSYIADIDKKILEMAVASGSLDAEQFMKDNLGPTSTVEGMHEYMEREYFYVRYYDYLKASLVPTMEQLEQYFAENAEALENQGVTKESGDVVDVRHVLIMPETSGKDEEGKAISTEEDWENCRQKAQALLDGWRSGEATEDTFHKLAQENSADGNASTGGLYTGVTPGYMVQEFNDWIFDENRAYGDSDLVKTQFGYHIMYFVKREPNWIAKSREGYVANGINEAIAAIMEQYPIQTNYDAIALS